FESAQQNPVQRAGRGEIRAERLFDDDARPASNSGLAKLLNDHTEQNRRNREVVCGVTALAEFRSDGAESGWVFVSTIHIAKQAIEFLEGGAVHAAVLFEAVICAGAELFETPARFGNPDHRHIESSPFHHRLERGKDFLVCKVAGGAEEDERIGMLLVHM